jgi:hypothetical protein
MIYSGKIVKSKRCHPITINNAGIEDGFNTGGGGAKSLYL